jgi:hypothetical protein
MVMGLPARLVRFSTIGLLILLGSDPLFAQTPCTTNADCNDSVACTVDECDSLSSECTYTPNDTACDDGLFCTGVEGCDVVDGCSVTAPQDCDDGLDCTIDTCNEGSDACEYVPNDSVCDDGVFCNGAEQCDALDGCVAGSAPDCDDGVACTGDACNEGQDSCDHITNDLVCDDGQFCNGVETCDAVDGCQEGAAPACDDGVVCTTDACDEDADACDNDTSDAACDDGTFCNGAETCDAVAGCQAGPAPDCDDGIACTDDVCDQNTDACDHLADNAACDDGLWCTGDELCDQTNGCIHVSAPDCEDGIHCTLDTCNDDTDSCEHAADDSSCDDGVFCNGDEYCDLVEDCEHGPQRDCDDGLVCTHDQCNESADICDHGPDDSMCDDHDYCDGQEVCDPTDGCTNGDAPVCDDGVSCTTDTCNEATDGCDFTPSDAACDDGTWCNGAETCDAQDGCQQGANPCHDGIDCTEDLCNEAGQTCNFEPDHSACDDGLYCTGAEACTGTGCAATVEPDCSDAFACTQDSCNEQSDSCDHLPVDGSCDDLLFCNGAETCDPESGSEDGCKPGEPPCADAIDCTSDECNENEDSCNYAPQSAACDNGAFCDGAETCDPVHGCVNGSEPCTDGVHCTQDSCNENADSCNYEPDDALCDDGFICNGAETCDPINDCESGESIECPASTNFCTENACTEDAQGCAERPAREGATCDDTDPCTHEDTCTNGECVGRPVCAEPCQACEEGACLDLCGAPFTAAAQPTTSDGLFVLHAAVGLKPCAACLCDVNDSHSITALDGLRIVRKAVGLESPLMCPAPTSTTTTLLAASSTTSSLPGDSTTTTL